MAASSNPLWRAAKTVVGWAIALLILFEEWGWAPLGRGLGRIARWPPVCRLERRIAGLGPHIALVVLFVPAVTLLPIKIGALWLVGLGRVVPGLAILVAAKILGTAVVARLFQLTQPQLMRLGWFANGYRRWLAWKTRVIASLVESPGWIAMQTLAARVRALWAAR
jgi:hypothetical protein